MLIIVCILVVLTLGSVATSPIAVHSPPNSERKYEMDTYQAENAVLTYGEEIPIGVTFNDAEDGFLNPVTQDLHFTNRNSETNEEVALDYTNLDSRHADFDLLCDGLQSDPSLYNLITNLDANMDDFNSCGLHQAIHVRRLTLRQVNTYSGMFPIDSEGAVMEAIQFEKNILSFFVDIQSSRILVEETGKTPLQTAMELKERNLVHGWSTLFTDLKHPKLVVNSEDEQGKTVMKNKKTVYGKFLQE